MSSREDILNTIKKNRPSPIELPEYDFKESRDNLFDTFKETIKTVGGDAFIIEKDALAEVIKSNFPKAKTVVSTTSLYQGNLDANSVESPKDLSHVDLAIVEGEFAIAENGAVWVQNPDNRHRGLYFIAENIVLIVDKEKLYPNMHFAYDHVSFENSTYGTFISGPSKTADIEQSLVIGAHGPKQGFVFFV